MYGRNLFENSLVKEPDSDERQAELRENCQKLSPQDRKTQIRYRLGAFVAELSLSAVIIGSAAYFDALPDTPTASTVNSEPSNVQYAPEEPISFPYSILVERHNGTPLPLQGYEDQNAD